MEIVAQASTGREAVQKFKVHRPDITLMHQQMPAKTNYKARELDIRRLIAAGNGKKEIAAQLSVTEKLSEWQLGDSSEVENMRPVTRLESVIQIEILRNRDVRFAVAVCRTTDPNPFRERIAGLELNTIRKPSLQLG